MNEITIRIPATTANLGPGYDCLGVALQIYNRITISRLAKGHAQPESEMVQHAARDFFEKSGADPFAFNWCVEGDVPRSRGLGSSVTVRLGILIGLNELAGQPLSRDELFQICAQLEGHPDNAAPAIFGGFTVAGGSYTSTVLPAIWTSDQLPFMSEFTSVGKTKEGRR